MSGSTILTIGMFIAFSAAFFQYVADKSVSIRMKHQLLLFTMIATAFSGWLNYFGSNLSEDENKEELKKLYKERDSLRAKSDMRMDKATAVYSYKLDSTSRANKAERDSIYTANEMKNERTFRQTENKIDNLHGNYTSDLKEIFGIVSRRSVDQFLSEKVPENLSLDYVNSLVSKAINKWFNDSIASHIEKNDIGGVKLFFDPHTGLYDGDSSGCWTLQCCSWYKLVRNYRAGAENVYSYWDAYLLNDDAPNDHTYISVIINMGKTPKEFYSYDKLTEKSKELFYKYGKWYELMRTFPTTHQTFHHIVIFIYDKKDHNANQEMIEEEMRDWLGNSARKPPFSLYHHIIVYDQDDLKNVHETIQ